LIYTYTYVRKSVCVYVCVGVCLCVYQRGVRLVHAPCYCVGQPCCHGNEAEWPFEKLKPKNPNSPTLTQHTQMRFAGPLRVVGLA